MGKLSKTDSKAVGWSPRKLLPSALGARVRRSGENISVTDGPFSEAKEVSAGLPSSAQLERGASNWPAIPPGLSVRANASSPSYEQGGRAAPTKPPPLPEVSA